MLLKPYGIVAQALRDCSSWKTSLSRLCCSSARFGDSGLQSATGLISWL